MGHLIYGNADAPIEVDVELLAHLRAVTVTKLRRNESFALTIPTCDGSIQTLWIHASIPLRFSFDGDPALHRPLLASMMEAANSPGGLDLTRDDYAASLQHARELQTMSA
jgi:hypothetical protein